MSGCGECPAVHSDCPYSDAMSRAGSTTTDLSAEGCRATMSDRGTGNVLRRVRGGTCGALVGVTVYLLVSTGWVPGPVAAALGVCLVFTVATSTSCGPRIAFNGSILVGWSQVLWWLRWPLPVNHGALAAAAA